MPRTAKHDRATHALTAAAGLGLAVLCTGCGIRIQTYSIDDEPFEQGDHEIIVAEEGSLIPPPGEFPRDATLDRDDAAGDDTADGSGDGAGEAESDDGNHDSGDGNANGDAPATASDQAQPGETADVEYI